MKRSRNGRLLLEIELGMPANSRRAMARQQESRRTEWQRCNRGKLRRSSNGSMFLEIGMPAKRVMCYASPAEGERQGSTNLGEQISGGARAGEYDRATKAISSLRSRLSSQPTCLLALRFSR